MIVFWLYTGQLNANMSKYPSMLHACINSHSHVKHVAELKEMTMHIEGYLSQYHIDQPDDWCKIYEFMDVVSSNDLPQEVHQKHDSAPHRRIHHSSIQSAQGTSWSIAPNEECDRSYC